MLGLQAVAQRPLEEGDALGCFGEGGVVAVGGAGNKSSHRRGRGGGRPAGAARPTGHKRGIPARQTALRASPSRGLVTRSQVSGHALALPLSLLLVAASTHLLSPLA
eukprot:2563330-Alexandrium_andersonii.AAC.1